MEFQSYLSQKYQGHESFLENIIFPIFGEDNYESSYDIELLDSEELRGQAARTGIRSIIRCGTIDLDLTPIEVFDITVSDRILMDKNRVGVQAVIRRVMDTYSGAFMIFHYDNDVKWDWRFTFCQMKDKGEFTDNKRYTFLLGPNQSCRTAAQNFQKLADLHENISIKDIVAAFDVEALSKAFFDGYKSHYERFVEFITGKRFVKEGGKFVEKTSHDPHPEYYQAFGSDDKAVRDYTKLLLARIVFLHFLQKKGWLGVPKGGKWGDGDEQFMKHLYERSSEEQKEDFLESVLEPLFFDALNGDRSSSKDVFDTKVIGEVRVPYLNGGLFSKDALDDVVIRYPKEFFGDFLEFLYQYNFTIDENDPNDAQVGIDPEMLGKIFENLLEDNKDKGAFYTPKEIVQYMCQESLIACLETKTGLGEDRLRSFVKDPFVRVSEFTPDEQYAILGAILNVKICDPAIGSGAFPIGLLNELVRCKEAIYGDEKGRAEIKKEIIRDNIYGVDIEKGAVDIARLRFWLSLIVDEEKPLPLPNLDYKIMQGNSLLEWYDGVDLSHLVDAGDTDVFMSGSSELKDDLAKSLKKYFGEANHTKKKALKEHISETIKKILDIAGVDIPDAIDIAENNKFFLWHTWFYEVFEKGGFDIIIGNPPYIKEYTNREAFNGFRESSPYYMGKMDLWYGFACHSIDYLADKGVLSFIAQNNWTTSTGAKKLRLKVAKDVRILQLLDFNTYMVFEDAGIQTMIMVFKKESLSLKYSFDHRRLLPGATKEDMLVLLLKQASEFVENKQRKVNHVEPDDTPLTFSDEDELLDKILLSKEHLYDDEVAQGIVFPQDFLDRKRQAILGRFNVGDGIFALSNQELSEMTLNSKEHGLIRPYYTSSEISRYYTKPENKLWLIYTDSSYSDEHSMDDCPVLKTHLDQFQSIITSSNKPYGLHRARKEHFFKGEKIVSLRKCVESPCFSFSDFDCYVTQTYFIIQSSRWDMRFLTGVLNSKLIAFWLKKRGKMQGDNYQIDKEPLLSIPLPKPTPCQSEISDIVATIIDEKLKNPNYDSALLEKKIDSLVYLLYGLNEDEIAIIENQ